MAPLTKAIDLLYLAKQNGVDITLNKEQLQLKLPKNKEIDKGLLDELRNNKQLIIDFLTTHKKADNNNNPIVRQNRESIQQIPLSFSQERLWFIDQMEGSVQYHIPSVLTLKGKLNKEALSNALQDIISRHEVLRTVFLEKDGQPYQTIRDSAGWRLEITEGSGFAQDQEGLQHTIQELIRRPFDLSRDYMVRAHLITLVEDDHVLVVTMHHIASDGWSISIIVKEVAELYAAYAESRSPQLVPLQIQYADYAIWQRNYLQGEVLDQKVAYWKNKLSAVSPLQLPTDHPRPAVWSTRGATRSFSIEKKLSEQIQQFSQQQGTTLFMTLLSAFNVLLHRYSGQQDICVGSPIANRTQQEVEGLIGFFVNTLALRSEVNADAAFTEFLQQVKTTMLEAYEHQELPFEKIVETVVKERDLSRNPLFQVMFSLQNTPEVSQLHLGDVELSGKRYENLTAQFDISLNITEVANGLQISIQYATDLYNEGTILRMMGHYKELLASIVQDPQQKIGELAMLSREEEQQLLYEFNNTKVDYPRDKSIVDLLEDQAARTPQAIAVVFEDKQLSYQQLNEKANQLAYYLRSKGVKEETLVPVCIERSLEMIVGIVGILKAGAAYVPLDPEYPQERISYMLTDTGARVVVCSKESRSKLQPAVGTELVELNTDWKTISTQPAENLQIDVQPYHLAYIIYTSGSTGKPKGVMIEHGNVVSLVKEVDYVSFTNKDILLSTGSSSFDATTFEYWGMLLNGGRLILCTENRLLDSELLKKEIEKRKVSKMWFTSSWFNQLVETDINIFAPLNTIIVGGEKLSEHHIKKIRLTYPSIKIVNGYGPTENTAFSLTYDITEIEENTSIPIGRPLTNRSGYVLNEKLQLAGLNIRGEIYLGGAGIARGYLNRPELTAEKFVKDPFSKERGARMYRTGDLGRWLPDGNIEYMGRLDDQVKIRGYRIELGEVESVLQHSELVSQCVVVVKEDEEDNRRLVGYVVPNKTFDKEAILSYLRGKLPEYMVPGFWVELESLPLTPNGKIDRKALPDPDTSGLLSNKYVAPRNETEKKLAAIWQELLRIERIGISDNFFELGGHSLLAMRVISAIRKQLEVELTIKDLFIHSTVAALAGHLSAQGKGSLLLPSLEAILTRPSCIPLSFSQERLWFIDQLEGSVQYHIPTILRLKGNLNKEGLAHTLKSIVDRHEVLRTVFLHQLGQAFQHIRDSEDWQLEMINGSSYQPDSEDLTQLIQKMIREPFDLSKDYMVRASLISLGDQDHLLVVTMHHIASDGWSTSIIVKEVAELYAAYVENRPSRLAPLTIQYADHAIWQRNYLQGEMLDKKLGYWKQKLEGVTALQLPTDRQRPAVWSARGASTGVILDKELSAQLQALSQQQGTTLYMTLMAAFKVLLHRYSGQQDICVGSPIANRTQQEVEGLIGFFVNTLALRSEVNADAAFTEFLQQVKTTMLEAYEHQELPFEKIVETVVKERDLSRNPLFQVMFSLQNTPEVSQLHLGDVELSGKRYENLTAQFDISLNITEVANGLQISIQYATDLYNEGTILRMMGHYKELLASIVQDPQQKIGELAMLSREEEQQLLYEFNNTKVDYPRDKSIVDLLEDQAARTPQAIAVVFEDKQLSYQQLNEKANQLAYYLRSKGVKEETLVPVCIERSLEMIVGIVGILKAGAAYVPLDPEYPQERISYMLTDTGARVVVCSKESRSKLQPAVGTELVELNTDWKTISTQPAENLQIDVQPYHLAYIIYTSGSTGKPKGVMIEHGNVVSLVKEVDYVSFTNKDILLSTGSSSFDATTFEYWGMLLNGGRLILCTENRLLDSELLKKEIEKRKVSKMWFTSSWFNQLVETDINIFAPLNTIIVGGEKLSEHHIKKIRLTYPSIKIVNGYGPTENTAFSLTYDITEIEENTSIPIGRPLTNRSGYVLNEKLQLAGLNIRGEIYLGGAGIARGYLNRPELTAEKFVKDPFSKERGARMYRTGDLGRWLPDGNIEYMGRLDDQVKIRGYRIELGEVESVLQHSELVSQCVVVVKEDEEDNRRLVGYVVPNKTFDKEAILSYLRGKLPEYMVPGFWVELESLPLTPNGKIDRKALPDPDTSGLLSNKYVAPRNETEKKLAAIWQELLRIERIGISDNFFELGGHSLLAMRVISAIRKQLEVELTIKDLFIHSTVAALAGHLSAQGKGSLLLPSLEAILTRPSCIPLSFSQERLWFIDQLEGSVQYHIPTILRLKGNLNKDALSHALQTIVDRHEVLRTVFLQQEGQAYQSIRNAEGWKLEIIDGSSYQPESKDLTQLVQELIREPFDLSKDYMVRASLISHGGQEHVLMVVMHHIASDGWSMSITVKELVELYSAYVENRPAQLPQLAIQYADYAIWQRNYLEGRVLNEKLQYWKDKLQDVKILQLPTDYVRPAVQSTRGAMVAVSIDKDLSRQLQTFSHQQNSTLFMTLLAAFKVLLFRYSGQNDICVGTAIAGRQTQELEALIGFFVNTLALRSEVNGNDSFLSLLKQVKKTTLEAYENQEVPFEKVVDAIVDGRDLGTDALVQVMFALQNTPEIPVLKLGECNLSQHQYKNNTALFELWLNIIDTPNGLRGYVNYCTDLYSMETMERFAAHFSKLLSSVVQDPHQKVVSLEMLSETERNELLVAFNDNSMPYPYDKNIVALFEEQVLQTPDNIAVNFKDQQITYKGLNERSNQVAHYLVGKGIISETLVPICIDRSLNLIIAILGILKAGGAYVPIDPEYPLERISHMLEDTAARIIVSNKGNRPKLKWADEIDIIEIDSEWSSIPNEPVTNLQTIIQPHSLAYVMYTSGSTGNPKGAMIEHRNVISLVKGIDYITLTEKDILLSTGSPSFDATTFEYWGMLLNGGRLVLCNKNTLLNNDLLKKEIGSRKVTKMWFTSSWFNQLVEYDVNIFQSLQTILVGGEKLSEQHIQKIRHAYPALEIINGYGPTENTTFSLTYRITETKITGAIPIGRPLNNRKAFVLDHNDNLVPVGVPGEVFLGGAGVARGYLNRPDLTAEKFISNPFDSKSGSKLYKTGDLGRWLSDGSIEYIRRLDDQVKIRGYRIELGEVETAMNKLELVINSCVVVKKDTDSTLRLAGYYLPDRRIIKAKERDLYARLLASWKELYESEYAKTEVDQNIDHEFNIIGWNDSFTGESIPPEQMQDWLQDVMEVIFHGKPQYVLEIGTGTGLIYFQLAGKIKKYIGTDFSRSSVNQITDRISKGFRDYGPTELHVCAAHEVSLNEDEQVDTIILNSIVQYFPGEDYMTEVIGKSISLLKDKGRIIIGDVRDNRLLELFKARLHLNKMPDSLNVKEFKWAVDQAVLKEEELCFSPNYFYRLQSLYPEITYIEIKWKSGSYTNELTLYRFTVIMYVGIDEKVIKPDWQSWDLADKNSVIGELKQGSIVALKDVPNPRLWRERLLNKALQDKTVRTVGELSNIISTEDTETIEVAELLRLALGKGYSYRFLLDENPLNVNLLLELHPSDCFIEQPYSENGYDMNPVFTNIPLFTDIGFLLQKDIRALLKDTLPDYMVPSELIALGQLPLTNNGKIDRSFLSQREERGISNKLNYMAPYTEVEQKLVEIWKKLLCLERVGINDNFFELGGHSLLAMRLISAIRIELGVQVPLIDIFNNTIQSLAEKIRNQHYTTKSKASESLDEHNIALMVSQAGERGQSGKAGQTEWDSNENGKYMIPIHKAGTKIPFFGVISFNAYSLLGNFMPNDQPLYYLPPTQSASVEDIASHYIKEIKLQQASGPYCIGGFCVGGMIALEIAQRLESQGDTVAVLVLFEFYSPRASLSRKSFEYKKRRLAYYKNRLISLTNSSQSPFNLLKFIKKKLQNKFRKRFKKITPPKFITSIEYYKYIYKPYLGKVILFQASIPPLEFNGTPLMGWSDYFKGEIKHIKVEGGHLGIFREPSIRKLAEKLSVVLEDVNDEWK